MGKIAGIWSRVQQALFQVQECLPPLSEQQRRVMLVLEVVRIEEAVPPGGVSAEAGRHADAARPGGRARQRDGAEEPAECGEAAARRDAGDELGCSRVATRFPARRQRLQREGEREEETALTESGPRRGAEQPERDRIRGPAPRRHVGCTGRPGPHTGLRFHLTCGRAEAMNAPRTSQMEKTPCQ